MSGAAPSARTLPATACRLGWLIPAVVLAAVLALPCAPRPAAAQGQVPAAEGETLPQDAAAAALAALERDEDDRPRPPSATPAEVMDPESRELVLERFRRYQQHQIAALEHRERLFRWQLRANQISFIVVLVLVFAGLVFSAVQFAHSLRTAGAAGDEPVHELSISAKGLTVRSSVIGLIVLALSLGFFYLYLVHVFPLEELPSHEVPTVQTATDGG